MKRLIILLLLSAAPVLAQNSITVTWSAPSGSFTGYTVYRSTVHGGPYTPVVSGLTITNYTNTGLANGTYFYVVTSFNGGVITSITGNGTTATATCAANCPAASGATMIIRGNSIAAFNGTFTSTGQPTGTTFTFSSSAVATGNGGGSWQAGAESNNSNESGAQVPIVRTLTFNPTSLTFPSTNVGSSAPSQSVTATNASTLGANVTVSSVTFGGTNPGDFSRTTTCGTVITTCTATVTFTPTAAGARSATLLFTDNATGSPQSIPLSGSGGSTTPAVTFAPTSLDFHQQIVSTSSNARSILLTNSGTAPLVISGITFTGTNPGDFSETDNCTTVGIGASCTINVTFSPSVVGARSANVSVADNAPTTPQTVPVQGIGATTQCTLTGVTSLSGGASLCQ